MPVVIDRGTESVVLKCVDPLALRDLLPRSKTLPHPDFNFAVHHTVESTKVLRNLGYTVPAPIRFQYSWPGRFTPFDHQIEMSDFLTMHRRCFNLSEMGTMKTNASLWAADWLMKTGRIRKALVIAPLSTLSSVWQNDIFETLPHRSAAILHGTRERRLKYLGIDADFYILNHDGIKIADIALAIAKRPDIDLVIVDEAGMYRNPAAGKYKALSKLITSRPDLRLWLMTGTPCPNAPTDAWALAKLVSPERVPKFAGAFKTDTMTKVSQFKWVPRIDAFEKAYKAMQPAIRFKKKDCIDLPPVTTQDHSAGLTPAQAAAIKQLKDNMITTGANGVKITAANAADQINKMRQVLCIAENTPVLTARGWVLIQHVTAKDKVWDGAEWVRQEGAVLRGRKTVISRANVRMTADHEVLTTDGWQPAWRLARDDHDLGGLERASVRLPECDPTGRPIYVETYNVVVPLRLREISHEAECDVALCPSTEPQPLRVSLDVGQQAARDGLLTTPPHLVRDEAALPKSEIQRLEELRRSGGDGSPAVGGEFRDVLGGHGAGIPAVPVSGARRQRQRLRAGKLPVGDVHGAGKQHSLQPVGGHAQRTDDADAGGDSLRDVTTEAELPAETLAAGRSVDEALTYDLVNCGPRRRFVVLGDHGQLLIVHNCGALKDPATGVYHPLPHAPRLTTLMDAIESASAKVLVIVPFKGIIRLLEVELIKAGITCAIVNGDVTPAKRTEIFKAFKTRTDPHVLLCHPKVMAHGLNLTEADTLIFYAPIYSNDEVEQVNERFNRAGQTRKMTIIRIGAHPLEWAIYKMTDVSKQAQNSILELYEIAKRDTA